MLLSYTRQLAHCLMLPTLWWCAALYCVRAGLVDGQDILELGCGWGSLCLFVARAYPKSRVTAVSNSRTQKDFIMRRCRQFNVNNLEVITADVVEFQVGNSVWTHVDQSGLHAPVGPFLRNPWLFMLQLTHAHVWPCLLQVPGTYDRILSIEMFEHMKNYEVLMQRISNWLKPDGKLFVHIFCHKASPYHFEVSRFRSTQVSLGGRFLVPGTYTNNTCWLCLLCTVWQIPLDTPC